MSFPHEIKLRTQCSAKAFASAMCGSAGTSNTSCAVTSVAAGCLVLASWLPETPVCGGLSDGL
eukprot:4404301-Amphidinium_carterae.1